MATATATATQDQPTREPTASTSSAAPPTAAPSRTSSKLNPQSAAFSFFQADEVDTSSSHSYPYRPTEDRPMPPPSMGMAPRGFLSNAMRNSGGAGPGMMMTYGQPYPMEMMQQGYGQQQHEHWGGLKSNGGWQQPPLPLNGNGNGMQGGGSGPRYYSPPPSQPSPYPLPTSHSGGVFFPVSNGPPLQPNLLPAFQLTRPTPFSPPSLSTAPPPSAPHTPPRSRRPRPPPPSEAPALSFGPNTRPPPGFVLPSSAPSSISAATRTSSTPAAPPQVVPKTAAASPLKPPSLPPAPPPPVVPAASFIPADESVASTAIPTAASAPAPAPAPSPAPSSPIAAPTPAAAPSSLINTPAPSTPTSVAPTPPSTTALSTAPPSSHSSPILTPQSPATTATTVSSDLEPGSLLPPSTPKAPPLPRKSWADLLRSPSSSSPPPLHPNGTPLSPITQHIPRAPPTKKTLAETLEGVESANDGHEVIPRGLINNGNMCFANAILQVLVYCSPFWNLVERVGRETKGDLGGQTPSMDAMILFLEEFRSPNKSSVVRHRSKSSSLSVSSLPPPDAFIPPPAASDWSDPFVPEQVYESIKPNKRFDAMRRGHQEDAEEFLGFFLDTLHDEILVMIDRVDKGKMPEQEGGGAAQEWLEVGSKGRTATTRTTETRESPITKIFGGQLRSVLRCSGQKDSITLEPYQRLQLDIQPDHVRTIEDALANLTLPEPLPDFVNRTGVRVEATKQVYLETFPPVLILHLKRFLYDNVGGVQKSGKSIGYGTELEIREDIIAPTKRMGKLVRYQLFGVVYHHGKSAQGGHYTVAVRQQLNSTSWIHIDDTAIRPILPGDVAVKEGGKSAGGGAEGEKGAYLLLYTRL